MSSLFLEVQSSLQDTVRSSKRKILTHGPLGESLPKIHRVLTVSPSPDPAHLGRGWEQRVRFSAPAVGEPDPAALQREGIRGEVGGG